MPCHLPKMPKQKVSYKADYPDDANKEKLENDFALNKERGLRLIEINECKAARKYLEAARKIKADVGIDAALKQCGY